MSSDPEFARLGPWSPREGNAYWDNWTYAMKRLVEDRTGCSVSYRIREHWKSKKLVVSGPPDQLFHALRCARCLLDLHLNHGGGPSAGGLPPPPPPPPTPSPAQVPQLLWFPFGGYPCGSFVWADGPGGDQIPLGIPAVVPAASLTFPLQSQPPQSPEHMDPAGNKRRLQEHELPERKKIKLPPPTIEIDSEVRVKLYSCGYKSLGMEKFQFKFKGPRYWRMVRKLINDKLRRKIKFCAMISLTQHARDPSHDKSLRFCWGENANILDEFLGSQACFDALRILKRNLVHDPDTQAEELHFAFMCRSGRHRSVAMTCIVRWILEDLGYRVTETTHVNRDQWGDLCTRCDKRCVKDALALKEKIRRRAIAMFATI